MLGWACLAAAFAGVTIAFKAAEYADDHGSLRGWLGAPSAGAGAVVLVYQGVNLLV
jgi:hypothetical protein